MIKKGLWVWCIAFLNDIDNSNKNISDKLRDIANVWVMFDYPENWKAFIYYMPVLADEEVGEDKVYEKFNYFLKNEKKI